ncbi:MAG: hypothetical protein KDK39_13310 [Leptospiraceae bacterium]|nr:hypothetical protein [Leptospiraceae bacterium]
MNTGQYNAFRRQTTSITLLKLSINLVRIIGSVFLISFGTACAFFWHPQSQFVGGSWESFPGSVTSSQQYFYLLESRFETRKASLVPGSQATDTRDHQSIIHQYQRKPAPEQGRELLKATGQQWHFKGQIQPGTLWVLHELFAFVEIMPDGHSRILAFKMDPQAGGLLKDPLIRHQPAVADAYSLSAESSGNWLSVIEPQAKDQLQIHLYATHNPPGQVHGSQAFRIQWPGGGLPANQWSDSGGLPQLYLRADRQVWQISPYDPQLKRAAIFPRCFEWGPGNSLVSVNGERVLVTPDSNGTELTLAKENIGPFARDNSLEGLMIADPALLGEACP